MTHTMTEAQTISHQELHERIARGEPIRIVDVRTPVEFREIHLPNANNIPLDRLDPGSVESVCGESTTLFLVCRTGSRATKAATSLKRAGFHNVVVLEGGIQAWEQAGLPVRRGKKAISLERQVRIAAGTLVVLGSVLAAFVHPYWAALSAFVGAGLVFAGITDSCGMALVLAKMPWNQVKQETASTGGCCGSQADGKNQN